jgi:hypothetical protein
LIDGRQFWLSPSPHPPPSAATLPLQGRVKAVGLNGEHLVLDPTSLSTNTPVSP